MIVLYCVGGFAILCLIIWALTRKDKDERDAYHTPKYRGPVYVKGVGILDDMRSDAEVDEDKARGKTY